MPTVTWRRDCRAVTAHIRLGDLTCPSGDLVVIDGGYLGLWSGDSSPAGVDLDLLGVEDATTAADIRDAVDFEIAGPDAQAAAAFLARVLPDQSLYDVPASATAAFAEAFAGICRDNGLDAALRATDRVPHRERARRAAAPVAGVSAGAFQAFGIPAVALGGLPTDRPRWVLATAESDDELTDGWWSAISLVLSEASVASSTVVGTVGVDWARLAFADAQALGAWQHDSPIDGLADVAFWGRSQEEAALANDAPLLTTPGDAGTYGWSDLPVATAVTKAQAVLSWVEEQPDRKLMVDFRPHSDHWRVMREVRSSRTNSGTVEVGGARILFTMTGRGDGFFPVYADRDAAGALVALRVVLAEQAQG